MAKALEAYNRKRDFQHTSEPEGKVEKPSGRLRFVVQRHLATRDHYDLRLEWGGALLSWAVPKGPSYNPDDKRLAIQVEDHPLEYRHFEGTIPKGQYGSGTVMLWDEGLWEPQGDVEKGLEEGSIKFILKGRRLEGKWTLVRMKAKEGGGGRNWLLRKERDVYAKPHDGIAGIDTSVRTGRTMVAIERGEGAGAWDAVNPFDAADAQLAIATEQVPSKGRWVYELKYDGYRMLAYVQGGDARLLSRNGQFYTDKFAAVAESLARWSAGRAMVLDGEVVVADAQGKTDFGALQRYIKDPAGKSLIYIVFDLLALDGADLRPRRLTERKRMLQTLLAQAPGNIRYSGHTEGDGVEVLRAACRAGMEGIIGKKADSPYSGTRNGDWIKIKCDNRQEFVIGGYTLTEKKTRGISALLLGVYDGGELHYAGRAGTGLGVRSADDLLARFEGMGRDAPPFRQPPAPRKNERVRWVEPNLVAEIKFAQWTQENLLRQASYKGLRTDKRPEDVVREIAANRAQADHPPAPKGGLHMKANDDNSAEVGGVAITNAHRVVFEGVGATKLDVARYYQRVSARMMPYIDHRVLSIVRCPKGIDGSCFYKKHPGPDVKGIVRIPIVENNGEKGHYFYIDEPRGLIAEAQMGTLEFHTWASRADDLEHPDVMVFDLDPDEGMDLKRVRQGVRDIKSLLDELSLTAYLKTSGGKGYHVVVPVEPSAGWDAFYAFSKGIALAMEQRWGDRYTSNVRKANRKDKIFIDWIRNGRGATSVAPYSLRAREGAKVSMPIAWEELDAIAPDGVDMAAALRRIEAGDPWAGFFDVRQRLKDDSGR